MLEELKKQVYRSKHGAPKKRSSSHIHGAMSVELTGNRLFCHQAKWSGL